MITKQIAVLIISITLVGVMFFLGNTKYPQQKIKAIQQSLITMQTLETESLQTLTAPQQKHWKHLTETLQKATTDTAKIRANDELFTFWGKDAKNDEIAVLYFAEKAKLENSEKNITFAANYILEDCITNSSDFVKTGFKASVAKSLFEKALAINPSNDSLNVGLGGCYIFGAGGGNPMEGISKVLAVITKDSTNAYGNKMLGYGNLQNGQTDKALIRFINAYNYNNNDVGLVPYIAMLSKKLGKLELANEWLQKAKVIFANDPNLVQQIENEFQSSK